MLRPPSLDCLPSSRAVPRARSQPAPLTQNVVLSSRLLLLTLALPLTAAAQMPARPATAPIELPRTHAPRPTSPAITAADLMTRLYIFADDSMQGRETGTEGNRRALRYVERELKRLGLTPMGDGGSYLQKVPLVRRGWAGDFTANVGGTALEPWTDLVPLPVRRGVPRGISGAPVIYGGMLSDAVKSLTVEQATGKVVVVRVNGLSLGAIPPSSGLARAAGIALLVGAPLPARYTSFFRTPGLSLPTSDAMTDSVPMTLVLSQRAAQLVFGSEPSALTPLQAGSPITAAALSFGETPSPAYNLVAMIAGSDPVLKHQYVAIGAHNDHDGFNQAPVDHDSLHAYQRDAWTLAGAYAGLPPLNREQAASVRVNLDSLRQLRPARRDSIYNGADDDGSGSMAVLEIAENIAAARLKPKRSVLFVWHTGEEKGLLGSQWFAEHMPVTRDSIVTQINIDMIGRGSLVDTKGGGPAYVGVVGSKRLSSMLGATIDSLATASRTPLDIDYRLDADGHPENIYCRSDHYQYARFGIPVAFFFTGLHGDYHQVTDEPQYIDYSHYNRITNYVRDLLVTVGNGAKPVVDKPKPDPTGQCRQ